MIIVENLARSILNIFRGHKYYKGYHILQSPPPFVMNTNSKLKNQGGKFILIVSKYFGRCGINSKY